MAILSKKESVEIDSLSRTDRQIIKLFEHGLPDEFILNFSLNDYEIAYLVVAGPDIGIITLKIINCFYDQFVELYNQLPSIYSKLAEIQKNIISTSRFVNIIPCGTGFLFPSIKKSEINFDIGSLGTFSFFYDDFKESSIDNDKLEEFIYDIIDNEIESCSAQEFKDIHIMSENICSSISTLFEYNQKDIYDKNSVSSTSNNSKNYISLENKDLLRSSPVISAFAGIRNFENSKYKGEIAYTRKYLHDKNLIKYGKTCIVEMNSGLMWLNTPLRLSIPEELIVDYTEYINEKKLHGYNDWRIPTIDELSSLITREGNVDGNYIDQLFTSLPNQCCLSSDKMAQSESFRSPQPWFVNFKTKQIVNSIYQGCNEGYSSLLVRTIAEELPEIPADSFNQLTMPSSSNGQDKIIRSTPATVNCGEAIHAFNLDTTFSPVMSRVVQLRENNDNKTIVDCNNNLQWDIFHSENFIKSHEDPNEYIQKINNINYNGYNDWRLPSMPELLTLRSLYRNKSGLYIHHLFNDSASQLYSSDIYPKDEGFKNYWIFDFKENNFVLRTTHGIGSGAKRPHIKPVRNFIKDNHPIIISSPKDDLIKLLEKINYEMVYVRPGTFLMGRDVPRYFCDSKVIENQHNVTISKKFYVGKTVVTQGCWQKVTKTTPWINPRGVGNSCKPNPRDDYPALYFSCYDVSLFLLALNQSVSGGFFRLPTEAEWEYACRAGSSTHYCFGDDISDLHLYAWYRKTAYDYSRPIFEDPHPVAQKLPNSWGLYDMHGNTYELCQDYANMPQKKDNLFVYNNTYVDGAIDPLGTESHIASLWRGRGCKIIRGGNINSSAGECESSARSSYETKTDILYLNIGIRLVFEIKEPIK